MFESTGWNLTEPDLADSAKFDLLVPTVVKSPVFSISRKCSTLSTISKVPGSRKCSILSTISKVPEARKCSTFSQDSLLNNSTDVNNLTSHRSLINYQNF